MTALLACAFWGRRPICGAIDSSEGGGACYMGGGEGAKTFPLWFWGAFGGVEWWWDGACCGTWGGGFGLPARTQDHLGARTSVFCSNGVPSSVYHHRGSRTVGLRTGVRLFLFGFQLPITLPVVLWVHGHTSFTFCPPGSIICHTTVVVHYFAMCARRSLEVIHHLYAKSFVTAHVRHDP